MSKAIAILAVLAGLASAGYALYLHNQPQLPYLEPHRVIEHQGDECAAWRVEQFVVLLCEGRMSVMYPKKQPSYSS